MEHPQSSKSIWLTRLRKKTENAPPPTETAEDPESVSSSQAKPHGRSHTAQFPNAVQSFPRRKPFEKRPWYLIAGPLGSGKSTALRHSGMMPSLDTALKFNKDKTAPATTDYELYSTHDAIWVDASGRYVDLSSDTVNVEEWRAVFKKLARQRSPKAFRGLLLMVSLVEHTPEQFGILTANAPALERQALLLRNFIHELTARFGTHFPVYLILTKCDLVSGFTEFFDDLEETGREQVWGSTFSSTLSRPEAGLENFERECERLLHVLELRRSSKLPAAETAKRMREIYNFPSQWLECQRRLTSFVAALFQRDPDREPVFWRGFYFISSVQEGLAIDGVGRNINAYLGLPAENPKPVARGRSGYFLKNLFARLIPSDCHLLLPDSTVDGRQRMRQWVCVAAANLLAGILISGLTVSYYGNKRLLQAAQQAGDRAAAFAPERTPRNLIALDSLRLLVESLEKKESLALRWGLYQGERIAEPVRRTYFASLLRILVRPVQAALEQQLNEPLFCAGNREACYQLLKTYLMLDTSRCQLDENMLRGKMLEISQKLYGSALPGEEARALARHIDFYVAHLKDADRVALRLDEGLVQAARRQLQGAVTAAMVYANMKAAAAENTLPMAISLETIFRAKAQDLLAGDYSVPGLFTKPGWERMRVELEKFNSTAPKTDCVLGAALGAMDGLPDRATMRTQLENLYFKEYYDHWSRFVQNVSLRRFKNFEDAVQSLGVIAGSSSPLMTLLKTIAEHTNFKQELTPGQSPEWGSKSPPVETTASLAQIRQDFQSVQRLLAVQEGNLQPPPVSPYFGAMADLRGALAKIAAAPQDGSTAFAEEFLSGKSNALSLGMASIDRSLENRDGVLRPLFEQPLRNSWSVILVAAQANLNKLWASTVYAPFVKTLATKYPFDPLGRDEASRTEASDFFNPAEGVFWSFFDDHLAGFVDRRSGRARSRPGFEGIRLSEDFRKGIVQADFLSKNLAADGRQTQSISLRLQPEPPLNAPKIDTIELQYDGGVYQYKSGERPIWTLAWPAADRKIRIGLKARNKTLAAKVFDGHWALFRMLRAARMEQQTLYWNFAGMKTNIGFTVVDMSPALLPMLKNLQGFSCPGKLD
jgi:type VI secretion system protein ImpL